MSADTETIQLGAERKAAGVTVKMRFLRSELSLVFRRKRNLVLLAVTAAFPVLMGIALKLAAPSSAGNGGGGPNPSQAFFNNLAGNGVFLAFIALTTLLLLVMPLMVSVVAGDSM